LPYIYDSILRWRERAKSETLSTEEREAAKQKLDRSESLYPQLRKRAGAFLLGWGIFDVLEDYYINCRWYLSREKAASLDELRDLYQFGYGASGPTAAYSSDKVWPLTVVSPNEEQEMLERVNGEELFTSALRKHALSDVIADGTASNVFFYEPFENVFMHAYSKLPERPVALVAMRINDWMFKNSKLLPKAGWVLSKLPEWERRYIESLKGKPFMEITISDCGLGIPGTLEAAMLSDEAYCKHYNIHRTDSISGASSTAWNAIKYAFESHSTGRTDIPPGSRGLAWLKEKMSKAKGMIQVVSNGGNYALADFGSGLTEISLDETQVKVPSEKIQAIRRDERAEGFLRGTFFRILFPLEGKLYSTPERRPRWGRRRPDPSLFGEAASVMIRGFSITPELAGKPTIAEWNSFFGEVVEWTVKNDRPLAILNFERQLVSRWAMENMFESFLQQENLHGRVVAVNCSRHVTCRLDTISSLGTFAQRQLVIPLFETNLRMYWAGATSELEPKLLQWFQHGLPDGAPELDLIAANNTGYFTWVNGLARDFSFGIEEIEEFVRISFGDVLTKSLEDRKAIYKGRYIMPLSDQTVSTFVEPHQIFAEGDVANLLCDHLAMLLRWRYGRMSSAGRTNMRILTATRIGRDIATRMPEAYPQRTFVYFDYHLVQPKKPRLLKHLAAKDVVIVVDVVSTGDQVEELVKICEDADAHVLGIISFIDFSPGEPKSPRKFRSNSGREIEHKTFWRSPQVISPPQKGDHQVNKETFSVSPVVEMERETGEGGLAILDKDRGLRLLEDSGAVHYGHYELFGRHAEFVTNFGRLITAPSAQREEIIRAAENAILKGYKDGIPTAIVLYPDFSNIHILQGILERRPRVRALIQPARKSLQFVEVRRGARARGRRYWLTQDEVEQLKAWANDTYQGRYSVLILDDGASSGETLLALLDLARQLDPTDVSAFVIVNRMPHLRTHHHRQIDRFAWASSSFRCLLHLNEQVYSRDNCPLCHERTELIRELRQAKRDWFRAQIEKRLERFDLITALHPEDHPEDPLGDRVETPSFSWEDPRIIPGRNQSITSRSLSVRTAINDGVPLIRVLEEVSSQPNDDVWHLSVIEIGRRVDLHLAQRCENDVRDALIEVLGGRNLKRRIAALEALRYMRPEAVLPAIDHVTHAALNILYGDELSAELLLLLRRVFSYRHLLTSLAFDKEQLVAHELDLTAAHSRPGSPLRSAIERINFEWGRGTQPRLNLLATVKGLERLFKSQRNQGHRLLYVLAEYISDKRQDFDQSVTSAIDDAVKATSLGRDLIVLLEDIGLPPETDPRDVGNRARREARALRRWVAGHMHNSELQESATLMNKLEDLKDLCSEIEKVLKTQLIRPVETVKLAVERFLRNVPPQLQGINLDIVFKSDLPDSATIVIHEALFREITRNLLQNLRHAIDPVTRQVKAEFGVFRKTPSPESLVYVSVKCGTRGEASTSIGAERSTTQRLLSEAEPYGVECFPPDPQSESPWTETWGFWSL